MGVYKLNEETDLHRRMGFKLISKTTGEGLAGQASAVTINLYKHYAAVGGGGLGPVSDLGGGFYRYEATVTDLSSKGILTLSPRLAGTYDFDYDHMVVDYDLYDAPPTVVEVGDAVRAELAAELANIDVTFSDLPALVRTNLATELARIDVDISSRLETNGYVAPDNAGIAQIASAVAGEIATQAALDAVGTLVAAIKAKTDGLSFSIPGLVDVAIARIAQGYVTGSGTPETDPWRKA